MSPYTSLIVMSMRPSAASALPSPASVSSTIRCLVVMPSSSPARRFTRSGWSARSMRCGLASTQPWKESRTVCRTASVSSWGDIVRSSPGQAVDGNVAGVGGVEGEGGSGGGGEVSGSGAARVGEEDGAAEAGEEAQGELDVGLEVEDVGGEDEV